MAKKQKIHALTINSESGDDYGVYIWKNKPSDEILEAWLRKNFEQEFPYEDEEKEEILSDDEEVDEDNDEEEDSYEEGPGIFGSCLHINWQECEFED